MLSVTPASLASQFCFYKSIIISLHVDICFKGFHSISSHLNQYLRVRGSALSLARVTMQIYEC